MAGEVHFITRRFSGFSDYIPSDDVNDEMARIRREVYLAHLKVLSQQELEKTEENYDIHLYQPAFGLIMQHNKVFSR
jgi:uncharacterized protein YlbG (UPF0298 family)